MQSALMFLVALSELYEGPYPRILLSGRHQSALAETSIHPICFAIKTKRNVIAMHSTFTAIQIISVVNLKNSMGRLRLGVPGAFQDYQHTVFFFNSRTSGIVTEDNMANISCSFYLGHTS
ncbi:hypothetical protein H5410_017566 [Solanum commersonii]|uniref:Uncharacterized protein n=1 Tax=Solanum commersonii TaxID=4109 RepID=A0A9J5ZZG3_SOLCO|nr:hypothetical protein H5410_017566 [Solanum commersonii]